MAVFNAQQIQEGIAWLQSGAGDQYGAEWVQGRLADLTNQLSTAQAGAPAAPASAPTPPAAPAAATPAVAPTPQGVPSATPAPSSGAQLAATPANVDAALGQFRAGQMSFEQLLQFTTTVNLNAGVPAADAQQRALAFLRDNGITGPPGGAPTGGNQRITSPQGQPMPSGAPAGAGGQAGGAAPAGWPQGAPYFWKYAITGYEPMFGPDGKPILDANFQPVLKPKYEQVPDFDAAIKWAQGFQDAAHQKAASDLAAAKFAWEKEQAAKQSPTLEQQLATALANGNMAEVARIREALAAPTSLQRAAEGRAERGFEQAFGFAQSAEGRAAQRAELENRLANARDQREADAARSELARLDAQEGRAASAFPLSQELLRNQDTRAAAQQAFGQNLQSAQFGLQAQGQAFGQGQQRLQSGLDILRTPGDYYLYQSRLRGQQPNQAFQAGGTAISRNAFLEPFGQQAFGGGQGQAAQQFGSLLQPEGGQVQPGAFGIGSGLQQAFAGQPIDRPRLLTSLGAPPFLNLQQQRNLLPGGREMHQAEVQGQGFYLPDFEEQQRQQNPQAFRTSSQAFRTAARPRAF